MAAGRVGAGDRTGSWKTLFHSHQVEYRTAGLSRESIKQQNATLSAAMDTGSSLSRSFFLQRNDIAADAQARSSYRSLLCPPMPSGLSTAGRHPERFVELIFASASTRYGTDSRAAGSYWLLRPMRLVRVQKGKHLLGRVPPC